MPSRAPSLSRRSSQSRHLYRYYEVQNGCHRDRWRDPPTDVLAIEYMLPHFAEAFERLGAWVEAGTEPPADQCIPRGGVLVDDPASLDRAGQCTALQR